MKIRTKYSIRDLEKLSGIKAHTLRIWEKRYDLLKPERTDSNIRFYTNDDLKRILNISRLNKNGIKISVLASMTDEEINRKVSKIDTGESESEDLIDSLIVGMIELDEANFTRIFSAGIERHEFENTILKVIFPFFHRIGIMWQTGGINPAQEHFMSNIVRQKLICAVDRLPESKGQTKSAVLFLPENELHELSLLFYNYALKARNIRTIYLGQNVPIDSLARVIDIVDPDYLIGVFTNPISGIEIQQYRKYLQSFPGKPKILLSGRALINDGIKSNALFIFKDLGELLSLIQD
jgi:MerR family transcriptional regulator, light-induced transcriptional regulator